MYNIYPTKSLGRGAKLPPGAKASTWNVDYFGSLVYENCKLKYMLFDGGYVTFADNKGSNPHYHFYIQDHLGNNRLVLSEDGTV